MVQILDTTTRIHWHSAFNQKPHYHLVTRSCSYHEGPTAIPICRESRSSSGQKIDHVGVPML